MQHTAIEKAAAEQGDTIVVWYEEKCSAKTMDRPELDRLRADIRGGKVRRVYGFRLDRFIRTGPTDDFAFAKECDEAAGRRAGGGGASVDDHPAAARAIRDRRAAGESVHPIAVALKVTKSTVSRAALFQDSPWRDRFDRRALEGLARSAGVVPEVNFRNMRGEGIMCRQRSMSNCEQWRNLVFLALVGFIVAPLANSRPRPRRERQAARGHLGIAQAGG